MPSLNTTNFFDNFKTNKNNKKTNKIVKANKKRTKNTQIRYFSKKITRNARQITKTYTLHALEKSAKNNTLSIILFVPKKRTKKQLKFVFLKIKNK